MDRKECGKNASQEGLQVTKIRLISVYSPLVPLPLNRSPHLSVLLQGALAEWHAISRNHCDGTADTFLPLRVP